LVSASTTHLVAAEMMQLSSISRLGCGGGSNTMWSFGYSGSGVSV
jgi:hypothetical protein